MKKKHYNLEEKVKKKLLIVKMQENFKIAIPVSHLFENVEIMKKLISISDILELRDNSIQLKNKFNLIYHSELNILSKWNINQINMIQEINNNYQIDDVSFHITSRYQINRINNGALIGVGNPFSVSEMRNNVRNNVEIIRNIFGNNISILVENNNHLLTDAYDIITSADFIREVVENNNINLLLDVAHALITAFNKNLDFKEYLSQLPLKSCKQIHLSKPIIRNNKAFDAHEELKQEDWSILHYIMHLTKTIKYVTIEYYKDIEKLISQIKILKQIQKNLSTQKN